MQLKIHEALLRCIFWVLFMRMQVVTEQIRSECCSGGRALISTTVFAKLDLRDTEPVMTPSLSFLLPHLRPSVLSAIPRLSTSCPQRGFPPSLVTWPRTSLHTCPSSPPYPHIIYIPAWSLQWLVRSSERAFTETNAKNNSDLLQLGSYSWSFGRRWQFLL